MKEHEEFVTIPRSAFLLLQYVGYFDRYRVHLAGSIGGRQAWIKTEAELEEAFGLRRFVDYDSFRKGLGRERKARLKKQRIFHPTFSTKK